MPLQPDNPGDALTAERENGAEVVPANLTLLETTERKSEAVVQAAVLVLVY